MVSSATLGMGPAGDKVLYCTKYAAWFHFQILCFTFINASLVGLLFVRISRGTIKASQVVFSDQAVIRCMAGGVFTFSFQLSELSFFTYHPALKARVSVYAVMRNQSHLPVEEDAKPPETPLPPPPGYSLPRRVLSHSPLLQSAGDQESGSGGAPRSQNTTIHLRSMRMTNPAIRFDGVLLLTVPQQLTHVIDPTSPLFPTPDDSTSKTAVRRSSGAGRPTSPPGDRQDRRGYHRHLCHAPRSDRP